MVALTVWVFGSIGLAQPVNDAFAQRTLIPGTRAVVASLEGATVEPGEPNHDPSGASGEVAHPVWWTWTAPAAGLLSLDASASGVLHPRVRAHAGGDLAALKSPPGQDGPVVGQDQMRFSVVTGQRLAVVLFTRRGDVGRAVLFLQLWRGLPGLGPGRCVGDGASLAGGRARSAAGRGVRSSRGL